MSDGVVALLLFSIPVDRELSGHFLLPDFETGRTPLDGANESRCVRDACRVAPDMVAVNRRGGASEGNGAARCGAYWKRDRTVVDQDLAGNVGSLTRENDLYNRMEMKGVAIFFRLNLRCSTCVSNLGWRRFAPRLYECRSYMDRFVMPQEAGGSPTGPVQHPSTVRPLWLNTVRALGDPLARAIHPFESADIAISGVPSTFVDEAWR